MSMLTPGTMHLQEQPYSPAASTVALSPPPPEYVQHAGHTPRPADLLPAEDCGHDTPTRLGTEHNAGFGGNDDYDDYDHDEDPALKGPLILPTDPGDGMFPIFLSSIFSFFAQFLFHRIRPIFLRPNLYMSIYVISLRHGTLAQHDHLFRPIKSQS